MKKKKVIGIKSKLFDFKLSRWDKIRMHIDHLFSKFILGPLGKCKHEITLGQVGEKWYHCIDCECLTYNDEWKEQRAALRKHAPKKIEPKRSRPRKNETNKNSKKENKRVEDAPKHRVRRTAK